ncbi:type IV pilus biogenesis/stability protein PilW [Comamonas endophytica]|uniref:Type IV pilus biogenesis/stability protein PilW n=1 Tax=Comamonas endophytica TaxID=2949090 RepID=A0ABY6GCU8_9BURK|nr:MULTISPECIES: type IV pilus biogenesis/stability protein PilW [unclassified Acidovorax]MCD2513699.1 type IV pilus biogenesis/stability protein PilW [Acidovorax sp. D4N7]UYG52294.1 type IV pilus biogenesis/stability protein PilW [Acidovorax sp. 5MLIR]
MNPGNIARLPTSCRHWGLAACLGLVLLTGCASGPRDAASVQGDIVTPSDESEVRRRARIRMELAASYFQLGKTEIALDEIKQSLATDPNYAEAQQLRGLIYMQLGDPALAEEAFRRALALAPRDANIMHNYGWLLCQQKRFAQADQQFDAALAEPRYQAAAKTWMAKGLCHESAGQHKLAEQALFKASEMDSGNPVVTYNLANVLYVQGEVTRARFYIRRLNNSEQANAESLWLGIKIERSLRDELAMQQLAGALGRRYPESREWLAYQRGAFNE